MIITQQQLDNFHARLRHQIKERSKVIGGKKCLTEEDVFKICDIEIQLIDRQERHEIIHRERASILHEIMHKLKFMNMTYAYEVREEIMRLCIYYNVGLPKYQKEEKKP